MKKFLFTLFGIAIIVLTSCKTYQNIAIADKPAVDTVKIHPKDTLSISLVSNASTGYKWHYDDSTAFLKLIETKSEAPASKLIGASGKQIFIFKARKKGKVNLKLFYTRGTVDTSKVFEQFVVIE